MPNQGYGPQKNPHQDALQQKLSAPVSPLGANGLPGQDMFGKPWPGAAAGPAPKPPTSSTMPIDPRPASDFTEHRGAGTAAGRDMSWMDQPGGTTYAGGAKGFTPKHAMEGFDFAREQNTGKSAKDAFAQLSNQAPPPPLNDKAALGAWFNQYIKPGMDALGHNVSDVQGDKFRFKNWQGDFWVDYGRGAGADGGALAWQAEDAGGAAAQAAPVAQRQGASLAPVMPGQTSDLLAQIMANLQAQQEPDPQALLMQTLI